MADLMVPGGGLTKSKLLLANANPSDVSSGKGFYSNGSKELQTGTLVERGTAQNAGGIGSGGSGSSAYIALNKIPEGIYRANGTDWGPEIRANTADVIDYVGRTYGYQTLKHVAENLGFLQFSQSSNDACSWTGRSCSRSSSAKAIWGFCLDSGGYAGWICLSLSSSGATLTSTSNYGESDKYSFSADGSTIYAGIMANRFGAPYDDNISLTIGGSRKTIHPYMCIPVQNGNTLSSNTLTAFARLLKASWD